MNKKLLQMLLKSALETEEYEITCEECFEVMDQYADLILDGTDPAEIMPLVTQHLKMCQCCTGELEAMVMMIQEAAKGSNITAVQSD
jgi:hypothetical protein